MTSVTKCDKCDKMWQNVTSMTKCDKCEKMWQVWQNVASVTKCEKYDKTWQVWQNMTSVTKHDKFDETQPSVIKHQNSDKMWQLWEKWQAPQSFRQISLHFDYFCIFKPPRNSSELRTLTQQMTHGYLILVQIHMEAKKGPFSYLFYKFNTRMWS